MSAASWLALLIALVGAVHDLRWRIIPNALTYPSLMLALAWAAMSGIAAAESAMAGMAIAALPFLVAFVLGGAGGGDVKLMAAVGALLGWPRALDMLFSAVIAAAAMILLDAIWSGRAWVALHRVTAALWRWLRGDWFGGMALLRREEPPRMVPFGVAVAAGTVLTLARPWLPR